MKPATAEFFQCVLADQPHYLVPARLLPGDVERGAASDLIVNPYCWFSWTGRPPAEIEGSLPVPARFRSDLDMVWVYDPTRVMNSPFWVGPRFRDSISHLRPGEGAHRLTGKTRAVLSLAGVLVEPAAAAADADAWTTIQSRAARMFHARGYSSVERLLHPFHLGALRRYYRHLLRTGKMTLGDSGSRLRYVHHNESATTFFHRELTQTVSQIAGVPVKPSYVYVSCYQEGADLPAHTDRAQCEYSITMLVDHSPEPEGRSPWPLYLDARQGTVAVRQHIGEALFYRGRELTHYRTRLGDGLTTTSIFFHYVDANFSGPLD